MIFAAAAFLQVVHYKQLVESDNVQQMFVGGLVWLVGQYGAHSGLASVRIGLIRQLGYVLPERYRYPLFAKDPEDFWTRWNTYLGDWCRMYIFYEFRPLLRLASRRMEGSPRMKGIVTACATVTTFLAIGVMHDAIGLGLGGNANSFTAWFLVVGILVVLWNVASKSVLNSCTARSYPSFGLWHTTLSRCSFMAVAVVMAAQIAS